MVNTRKDKPEIVIKDYREWLKQNNRIISILIYVVGRVS